jgi:hypothetical protein
VSGLRSPFVSFRPNLPPKGTVEKHFLFSVSCKFPPPEPFAHPFRTASGFGPAVDYDPCAQRSEAVRRSSSVSEAGHGVSLLGDRHRMGAGPHRRSSALDVRALRHRLAAQRAAAAAQRLEAARDRRDPGSEPMSNAAKTVRRTLFARTDSPKIASFGAKLGRGARGGHLRWIMATNTTSSGRRHV